MNRLAIGTESAAFTLLGEGRTLPFKGATYRACAPAGETAAETIELALEDGDPLAIAAGLEALERAVAQVEAARGVGVYLFQQARPGEETWRSRLLEARLEPAAGERGRGSLGVRVCLLRENAWEGALRDAPLSNVHGARVTAGLSVDNHLDGLHCNFVEIDGGDVGGGLPAPVVLSVQNTTQDTERSLLILAGQAVFADGEAPDGLPHFLEGEAGTGGTTVLQPGCSAGACQALSWSAPVYTELLAWTLSSAQLRACAGRSFRPLLRLHEAPAYNDLWLELHLSNGSLSVRSLPKVLAPPTCELIELPVMQLPPAPLEASCAPDASPLTLTLCATRNAAGTHSLKVDFLALLPLEGWRRYEALAGLAWQETLVDDGGEGVCSALSAAGLRQVSHLAYGKGLKLTPGRRQRLYFLHDCGPGAPVERTLRVRVQYRPRRRLV